jgi:ATP-dependent DNA helicase RecQ
LTDALELLKKYWGHNTFKSLQKPIIDSVLTGRDTVALLPTGGGKSVCFQIPALLQDGICIVVSPLVALITDQVNSLKDKGIKALALTGGLSFNEVTTLLDNALYGNYKFLYLSPERLSQELVQNYIKQMHVSLFAIDEAHCISQWGNDFRPAYKNIFILRSLKPLVPFIAVTATATPEVLQDTIIQLKLEDPQIFKQSFYRENLAYKAIEKDDKLYFIKQKLMPKKPTALVYVRSRKLAVETAQHLSKMGIPSTFYHGGMSPIQKKEVLKDWLSNKTPVIVATNAFGMGIDKPDVRFVFHIQLPESIEHYFQEAGRAGRDGNYAEAIILYNQYDISLVKNQFIKNLASPKDLKYIYRKLNNFFQIPYGEGEFVKHSFNFSEFCKTYSLNYTLTYNALTTLDRLGVLQLSKQFGRKSTVQFLATSNKVLHFLEENPNLSIITKTILRIYGGIFETPTSVNLELIASKTGQEVTQIIAVLQKLKKSGLIDFQSFNTDATITFLVPREDEKTINRISKEVTLLNSVKEKEVNAVIHYTTNDNTCKNVQLLRYFGEEDVSRCGICNVCASQQTSPSNKEVAIITQKIITLLEEQELSSKDICENLTFAEPKILTVIQLLLDTKKIGINSKNQYHLY